MSDRSPRGRAWRFLCRCRAFFPRRLRRRNAHTRHRGPLGPRQRYIDGALQRLSAKNNVEVIDYITSMDENDKLTAAAEALARTGHDIIFHRDWMIISTPGQ